MHEMTRKNKEKGWTMETKIFYPDESYAIMGACFQVYKEMGNGFLEPVYQECVEIEFQSCSIPFEAQKELQLMYRVRLLKRTYKPDFVCNDKIIVEIKAVSNITDEHRSQILNYQHATKFRLGILVNFGHHPKLEYERFVL